MTAGRKLAALALLAALAAVGLLERQHEHSHGGGPAHDVHVMSGMHGAADPVEPWLGAAAQRPERTVENAAFENSLRIPPLRRPRTDRAGRKVFHLTVRPGVTTFLPGTTTATWGVNGPYLGPTLRASRGDRVRIEVTNRLPVATTMHWHGMHLPAVDDGGPHEPIDPGATWSPAWRIDQPAATLWYHPHPDGETADQVYRGVAGMFILDDPASERLALPRTYGVDDVPVIIQDKRFHDDGSLDFSSHDITPTGLLGDRILINGTLDPHLTVTRRRVRLRLLNASNARIYDVGFADRRTFQLIATDQGLVDRPHALTRIQLSPGERAEIVASFRPGERTVLRSFAPQLGTNFFLNRLTGGEDSFDLLQLRAARRLAPSPRLPRRLVATPVLRASPASRTREFVLGEELTINGHKMDMDRVDDIVTAGSTELWDVRNASPLPHNFHVHGAGFWVLEYAGGPPPPALAGPKDTVYVPPHESVRLLIHFGDYPDPAHPYMFHCHLLAHEDHGMMGQFVLVRPGGGAAAAQGEHMHM